jgi:hypothetical protein
MLGTLEQLSFLLMKKNKVRFKNNGKEMFTKQVSRDHKPDDPEEAKKILECGGRIDTFKDQNGGPLGP